MSADNYPGIPRETIDQIMESLDKLQQMDMDYEELGDHFFSAMGKARIDADGVNLHGDYGTMGINADEFQLVKEAALKAVDFGMGMLPHMRGKQIILKIGEDATKLKIGLIPGFGKPKEADLTNEEIPMVEVIYDAESESIVDVAINEVTRRLSGETGLKEKGLKIHRLPELVGWVPSWKEFSDMMNIAIELLPLTKMKTVKRISASVPGFLSDVLNRCGEGKK